MSTDARTITIIEAIEHARGLHDPDVTPDEYPEFSRGAANLIADLYGFDQDDIPGIIRVIRRLDSIVHFAVITLQTPWMSDPTPSERQIATRRELSSWLEQLADRAELAQPVPVLAVALRDEPGQPSVLVGVYTNRLLAGAACQDDATDDNLESGQPDTPLTWNGDKAELADGSRYTVLPAKLNART